LKDFHISSIDLSLGLFEIFTRIQLGLFISDTCHCGHIPWHATWYPNRWTITMWRTSL